MKDDDPDDLWMFLGAIVAYIPVVGFCGMIYVILESLWKAIK